MSFEPVLYPSAPWTSCVLNPNQLFAFHKAGPKTRSIYTNVICQTYVQIFQTRFLTNTEAANHIVSRTVYICPFILRSIFLQKLHDRFTRIWSLRSHTSTCISFIYVTLERPWLRHVNRTIKTNFYHKNSN